jgi:transcription initiation factor TFIIB
MATLQIENEINESSPPTGANIPPVGGVGACVAGGNPPRNRTKKIKHSKIDKKALWDSFDLVQEEHELKDNATQGAVVVVGGTATTAAVECVFRATGERELCDCCQSSIAITDEGFFCCTNRTCGIIYTDMIDQGAEWRYYGADDNQSGDPTRCGMPINPLLKESSFGCKVICPAKSTYEMRKIRRYTEWQGMPYEEKARYEEFQRINVLANQAGISKMIIDDAMRYHTKISEVKTFRGDNRDGIIAATIYIAARNNNCPRTAKEIAQIFHLDNTSATRGCKNASSILNEIEHDMDNNEKTSLCNTTPLSFIERYCSRLNINAELTKLCKFIATRIQSSNLIPENTPHSIAAGIVFFVAHQCKLNISKKNVNTVSEISEVTINKCYKKLEALRDTLIPKAVLAKYGG